MPSDKKRVAIIGGGAAGCFAAINLKRARCDAQVTIYEGHKHVLEKVSITGGGRCNLTNSFQAFDSLGSPYPRGGVLMKRLLSEFGPKDTYRWFEHEGVRLMTQDDGRVFPLSQDAMEVVNTLHASLLREGVTLKTQCRVEKITREGEAGPFHIHLVDVVEDELADAVLVATGGFSRSCWHMLQSFNLLYEYPVPSLFSFCLDDKRFTAMTGMTINPVRLSLADVKSPVEGPLLITHWGVSGPAVLKLSALGARSLSNSDYNTELMINWLPHTTESHLVEWLTDATKTNRRKQLGSVYPAPLNSRLWRYLLTKNHFAPEKTWKELSPRNYDEIARALLHDKQRIVAKNPYKEEFVTCGGIALNDIDIYTLQAKKVPGLYFAGEVLDIDGYTGGFNLQAAWTMGYITASRIANS